MFEKTPMGRAAEEILIERDKTGEENHGIWGNVMKLRAKVFWKAPEEGMQQHGKTPIYMR